MTSTEKLTVINSMSIIDTDFSLGELIYALVDCTQENLDKLAHIVPNVNEYMLSVGDPDGEALTIDISTAAFEYAGADYFAQGKFRIDATDLTKIETLEAEVDRLNADVVEAADLHLETILELQRIQVLLAPICDENERLIGVALNELEAKFHEIHDKWSE